MSYREAFQDLYAASYQRLVLQLYPLTGDLGEAQDVVQEAFVRLLARPGRASALDNPEAWLRTVAVNLARDQATVDARVVTAPRHRRENPVAQAAGERKGPVYAYLRSR